MPSTKILIVDDEARMRRLLADFLKREGLSVIEAEDGQQALDIFREEAKIELVILDVMMPRLDGWAVCRELRKISQVPIIMLTARGEEADELFGFELGADEYISKPFSPMVVIARVKALLRRYSGVKKEIKRYDGLEIDETGRNITINGTRIEMTPKEYELLVYLAENNGIALSRDQILNTVWDYDYFGDARTVDTHIKRLRVKLEDKGEYIQTIRGFGYKFEVLS